MLSWHFPCRSHANIRISQIHRGLTRARACVCVLTKCSCIFPDGVNTLAQHSPTQRKIHELFRHAGCMNFAWIVISTLETNQIHHDVIHHLCDGSATIDSAHK